MQKINEDYKCALSLLSGDLSHDDLIKFLYEGNVVERQYSALNLTCLKSETEAKLLLNNLVGVDGKIREAAALKIYEMTATSPQLFLVPDNFNTFAQATIDIDGNVCRLAISSACNLSNDNDFSTYYANKMLDIIEIALGEIDKFTFRDKKYKINKQIFKIYWCLEALKCFYKFADRQKFCSVIRKCSLLSEYTVREKCANILISIDNLDGLADIVNKLKNDENYYVRKIFE